jgi:hypothetical protein
MPDGEGSGLTARRRIQGWLDRQNGYPGEHAAEDEL